MCARKEKIIEIQRKKEGREEESRRKERTREEKTKEKLLS
jgi:hypothetical protein